VKDHVFSLICGIQMQAILWKTDHDKGRSHERERERE
jgi:hypothetical protein